MYTYLNASYIMPLLKANVTLAYSFCLVVQVSRGHLSSIVLEYNCSSNEEQVTSTQFNLNSNVLVSGNVDSSRSRKRNFIKKQISYGTY